GTPGAVVMAEAQFNHPVGCRLCNLALQKSQRSLHAFRVDEVDERFANNRVGGDSEDPLDRRTLITEFAIWFDDGDEIGCVLDNGTEMLLAASDDRQRFFTLGHVARKNAGDRRGHALGSERALILPQPAAAIAGDDPRGPGCRSLPLEQVEI